MTIKSEPKTTSNGGGHPRACAVHPEAFAKHCAELDAIAAEEDEAMILDHNGNPLFLSPEARDRQRACDHGVTFDDAGLNLSSDEVRRRWPRLNGPCPKGCGYVGIAYASPEHYIAGDW